jgi:hypothetical protein
MNRPSNPNGPRNNNPNNRPNNTNGPVNNNPTNN